MRLGRQPHNHRPSRLGIPYCFRHESTDPFSENFSRQDRQPNGRLRKPISPHHPCTLLLAKNSPCDRSLARACYDSHPNAAPRLGKAKADQDEPEQNKPSRVGTTGEPHTASASGIRGRAAIWTETVPGVQTAWRRSAAERSAPRSEGFENQPPSRSRSVNQLGRSGGRPHGRRKMARWRAKPLGLQAIAVDIHGSVVMRTDGSGRVGPASEANSGRPCHTLHGSRSRETSDSAVSLRILTNSATRLRSRPEAEVD
jgi:hypothetical protein